MKKTTKFLSGALTAFILVAGALNVNADPGDIFVSQTVGGGILPSIYKITPNGVASEFATGFVEAAGLAFDNAGNLFVVDGISRTIYKFTPNGTRSVFATNVGTGNRRPLGLAFNSAGYLFVANGAGQISKYAPDGTRTVFAGSVAAFGLAFNSAG